MNEAPAKRLHIKTYGCQMNVYDSERMADILRPLGYALTDEVGRAEYAQENHAIWSTSVHAFEATSVNLTLAF